MVLRIRYLAVFLEDSRASSIPVHLVQYGAVPFRAAGARQIDGNESGGVVPEVAGHERGRCLDEQCSNPTEESLGSRTWLQR
jgi:hypothetical protein